MCTCCWQTTVHLVLHELHVHSVACFCTNSQPARLRCFSKLAWMALDFSAPAHVSGLPDLWRDLWKTFCSSSNRPVPCFTLFRLIIFSMLPLQCAWKGLESTEASGVRRTRLKMQVSSALHLCSAAFLWDFTARKSFELLTLQLSVKSRALVVICFADKESWMKPGPHSVIMDEITWV